MYMNEHLAPARQRAATAEFAPLLNVDGVTLQYKTREHLVTATYRVSFQVLKSDRYILLGPSGCGKSTLLKAVGGFLQPTEGSIRLNGRDVKAPGPDRMMVFQEFDQLLPWKTVRQNVAFTLLKSGKLKGRAADEKAMQYIEKVNLAKFADSYPHMLSGGMKQRVAIARAMAMEPDILLMDEPFAALDEITRFRLNNDLLHLWSEDRFTVVFVTHSVFESVFLAERVVVMAPRPGRIAQEVGIAVDGPRDEAFRTSAAYAEHCRTVSAALSATINPAEPPA